MKLRVTFAGMTLVEVMLAVALSAVLFVSLTGVLRGLKLNAERVDRMELDVWPEAAIELIRRDLLSSESMWGRDDDIHMLGDLPRYSGADVGQREIVYAIQRSPSRKALVRIDGLKVETLAFGPTRVSMERMDQNGTPQPLPVAPGPVPHQIRVWIWQDDELIISRTIVLR